VFEDLLDGGALVRRHAQDHLDQVDLFVFYHNINTYRIVRKSRSWFSFGSALPTDFSP
jgi:hypothetical protein